MKRRTKGLATGLAVVALVGLFAASAQGGDKPLTPEERSKYVTDAPRRALPSSPNNRTVIAYFRNCKWHIETLPKSRHEVRMPDGAKQVIERVEESPASLAKLPPQDPRCDGVGPTPEQTAEMRKTADAMQAAINEQILAESGGPKPPPSTPEGWVPPSSDLFPNG